MKLYEEKYNEAIERNLLSAQTDEDQKWQGFRGNISLKQAKHKLGIKQNDNRYDSQAAALIAEPLAEITG